MFSVSAAFLKWNKIKSYFFIFFTFHGEFGHCMAIGEEIDSDWLAKNEFSHLDQTSSVNNRFFQRTTLPKGRKNHFIAIECNFDNNIEKEIINNSKIGLIWATRARVYWRPSNRRTHMREISAFTGWDSSSWAPFSEQQTEHNAYFDRSVQCVNS